MKEQPTGQPVEESSEILKKESKWYDKKTLVIILLIIFFPVGIYALWKNKQFSTITKSIITGVVIFSLIFFIISSQEANDALSETNKLWNAGQKGEAIKIYNDMIESGDIVYLDSADSCTIYKRVIEFNVENGNISPAKSLIQNKMDICDFSFQSAKTGNLYKEVKLEIQKKRLATERKKMIEDQFSSFSGAHRNFEALIKDKMHDPKSYKHVKTTYRDEESYLIVKTEFRGKNALGVVVMNSVTAEVSLNGDVLGLIN